MEWLLERRIGSAGGGSGGSQALAIVGLRGEKKRNKTRKKLNWSC